ncbi:MAG: hypothetical protein QGI93_05050 [Planctomycetota bacterium]|nr:hypothetical protein [Planctomycetota bacterium]
MEIWDPLVGAMPGMQIDDLIELPPWLTGRLDNGELWVSLDS